MLLFFFPPLKDGKKQWVESIHRPHYGNFSLLKENFMETKKRIKVNAGIQEYTNCEKVLIFI